MAYREPSAPPRATTRLEYGPYPLDWRSLPIAALMLVAVVMFGSLAVAPKLELVFRLCAVVCTAGMAWICSIFLRLSLGATRRLSIVLEGEGDERELEVRQRRQLGERTRRVSLRGIRDVQLSRFDKHQNQIVLRFDGGRGVVLLHDVGDHLPTVAEDLRRELLPDAAAGRGSGSRGAGRVLDQVSPTPCNTARAPERKEQG